MRKSQLTAALIVFAAAGAACDNAYDPDAPAIDPNAPRIHITSPERGTFAGAVQTIEVKGNVVDDTAVTSVTVNDTPATVNPDGTFSVIVTVEPGTNLLHAVAKDAQGNTGKETRAVVAGKLSSIDRTITQAITASLSAQTFNAIGTGAGKFIQDTNLTSMVTPMNPVVDYGTENGVPDCLYAQAHITGLDVGKAKVSLAPQAGGLYMDATLENVRMDTHLQWAVSCLDGSKNVGIGASKIRVKGMFSVGIKAGGEFDIKLVNPQVTVTGFDVDLGGVPGEVIDYLDLDQRMGPIIGWATERFVVPMLNNAFNGLNDTKTIEVFGKQIDIALAPNRIEFDVVGAIVMLDSELRAQGDESSPGFVYVANTLPAMDKSQGFQLAIADDAANQLLSSLWAAKALEVGLDLKTGSYGEVGKLYDRVEITAKVPPHIDASNDRLRMTIGDLIATFKNGEAIATQVAINAQVDITAKKADGVIRLDVGSPTTYVDILDENVDGTNALSNAQFEAIATFALGRVIAVGSGSVGAIPLPSLGGVSVKDVDVSQQTGYLVVDGEVQ
jgi:Glucodextranase, domain B